MTNIEEVVINYLKGKLNMPVRVEFSNEREEIPKPYVVCNRQGGTPKDITGYIDETLTIQAVHESMYDASELANQIMVLMVDSADEVPEIMHVSINHTPYDWSTDKMYKYQLVCEVTYKFQ